MNQTIEIYRDGLLIGTDSVTLPDEVANDRTLRAQAVTALAANRAALSVTNPTNAQLIAQVKALTRQNNALIRLALNLLDGTD